jgi:hypothetical protein
MSAGVRSAREFASLLNKIHTRVAQCLLEGVPETIKYAHNSKAIGGGAVLAMMTGSSRAAEAQLWTAAAGGVAGNAQRRIHNAEHRRGPGQAGHYLHEPHEYPGLEEFFPF